MKALSDHYLVIGKLLFSRSWKTLGQGSHRYCVKLLADNSYLIGEEYHSLSVVHRDSVGKLKNALKGF